MRASVAAMVGTRDVKGDVSAGGLADTLSALWFDVAARVRGAGWAAMVLPGPGSEGEARALAGLGGAEGAALAALLGDCRRCLSSRAFDGAVRAGARALLAGVSGRAVDAAFGEGAALAEAGGEPSGAHGGVGCGLPASEPDRILIFSLYPSLFSLANPTE